MAKIADGWAEVERIEAAAKTLEEAAVKYAQATEARRQAVERMAALCEGETRAFFVRTQQEMHMMEDFLWRGARDLAESALNAAECWRQVNGADGQDS